MALALQLGTMLVRPLAAHSRLGQHCKLRMFLKTFTTSTSNPVCRRSPGFSYIRVNSPFVSLTANLHSAHVINVQFTRRFHSFVRRFAQMKRPFDMDTKQAFDVIVYTYQNDRFYKMLTVFGIVQFFFWLHLAGFCYRTLGSGGTAEKAKELLGSDNSWAIIMGAVEEYRYRIAAICMLLAYVVMLFAWAYPHRSVSKLTLLKGGESLRVTTYTHFGRKRDFEVPLSNCSFLHTRKSRASNLAMKIKGRRFYYLLDKTTGTFQEPAIFDYVVGLKREL